MNESTQDLIDFLNGQLVLFDSQIANLELTKTTIDQNITTQEQSILQMEAQKANCDTNIATLEQNKIYTNELILIVEAVPSLPSEIQEKFKNLLVSFGNHNK